MAVKSTSQKRPKGQKYPRKEASLRLSGGESAEDFEREAVRFVTSPEIAAIRVFSAVEAKSGLRDQIDVPFMQENLREQAAAVNRGDLSQAEAMLMSQATALQCLFVRLVESGMIQSAMPNFEGFLRLALRTQNQCRATLETLATIRNPPIVYARQANVTTGPQQINNGTAAPSQARQIESEQSQLSGGTHELLPDTRASGYASRVNPALETLGESDRAEIRRG